MHNKFAAHIFNFFLKNLVFIIFAAIYIAIPVSLRVINHTEIGFAPAFFVLGFFKALFFTSLLALICCGKRVIKSLLMFICAFFSVIYICLLSIFQARITPKVLLLIFQTNRQEVNDFLSAYISLSIILAFVAAIAVMVLIYIIFDRLWQKHIQKQTYGVAPTHVFAGVALVTALCSGLLNLCPELSKINTEHIDRIGKIKIFLGDVRMPYQEIYSSYEHLSKLGDVIQPLLNGVSSIDIEECHPTTAHIIWVIGESAIKSHFNIYGYKHATNPTLSHEYASGNLFVFNDVLSKYRDTANSMMSIFTSSDLNEPLSTDTVMLLPAVMKKAGYRTEFYDNQTIRCPKLDILKEEFFFDPSPIHENCFDFRNSSIFTYDHEIIESWLHHQNTFEAPYSFTMFHLKGEHFEPEHRFPQDKEYLYFNADSIRRKGDKITKEMLKGIANYDNAVRYNDIFMKIIIDHYRDKEAVLIFSPDHGECVYDNASLNSFRSLKEEKDLDVIKSFHEVPFFIWCSDAFINNHPEIVKMLIDARDVPFLVQDVSQIIYELAGIKGAFIDSTLCPIHKKFIPRERLIYNGPQPFNYDEKRQELDTITMQSAYN